MHLGIMLLMYVTGMTQGFVLSPLFFILLIRIENKQAQYNDCYEFSLNGLFEL